MKLDLNQVKDMRVNRKMSNDEIAEVFCCHASTVSKFCTKHSIDNKHSKPRKVIKRDGYDLMTIHQNNFLCKKWNRNTLESLEKTGL